MDAAVTAGLYAELYDYATLEAAYEAAFLYLEAPPEEDEAWIINLQNHLIWKSYAYGEDPDMDTVVLLALDRVLKTHGLKASDVEEPELRQLITTIHENLLP